MNYPGQAFVVSHAPLKPDGRLRQRLFASRSTNGPDPLSPTAKTYADTLRETPSVTAAPNRQGAVSLAHAWRYPSGISRVGRLNGDAVTPARHYSCEFIA